MLPAGEKRRSNPDLAIANLPLTFFPSRCLDCVLGSVKFGNAEWCHILFEWLLCEFSGDKHGYLGSGLVEGGFRSGLFLGRVGKGWERRR